METLPKKIIHPLRWFENRAGKEIIKNCQDLFNPPVLIASKQHAKALFNTQKDKGYRYTE
jgi:hypothetical protein